MTSHGLCTFGAGCMFGISLASALFVVQIVAGILSAALAAIGLYGAIRNKAWRRR